MERQAVVECVGPGTARRQIQPRALTSDQPDEVGDCPGRVRIVQFAGEVAQARGEIRVNPVRLATGGQDG